MELNINVWELLHSETMTQFQDKYIKVRNTIRSKLFVSYFEESLYKTFTEYSGANTIV